MTSKTSLNTPRNVPELKDEVRRVTKQALLLAPAAFVVAVMFGALGMKTMFIVFCAIAIFCVVSTSMVNVLMMSLQYLIARKGKQ